MAATVFKELASALDAALPELISHLAEAEDLAACFLALSQALPPEYRAEQLWRVQDLVEKKQWPRLARFIFFSMRVHGQNIVKLQSTFPAPPVWTPPRPSPFQGASGFGGVAFGAQSSPGHTGFGSFGAGLAAEAPSVSIEERRAFGQPSAATASAFT